MHIIYQGKEEIRLTIIIIEWMLPLMQISFSRCHWIKINFEQAANGTIDQSCKVFGS
jgi:hypothetical protein